MAAPFQEMLRSAVQSVQWTYSLFWQYCPQQGMLLWVDGYYNGAIKTRKTVQPTEVTAEEASLQRSQQLRELYDSLSAGDINQPARRPCASLAPEDLSESEWFYLMCVSFSFAPGVGLPGKAYSRRQHVWLAGAAEIDSKNFSRAILAKSARIQTVVCIPILDGVVELGYTEKVDEEMAFVQHVKSFFINDPSNQLPFPPPPSKPALSEHSTSNPTHSSGHQRFHSPSQTEGYIAADGNPADQCRMGFGNDEDDEDEDEDDEDDNEFDSEGETGRLDGRPAVTPATMAQPSELIQLELSEDIRLGSPDDGSNNMDSDFTLAETGRLASDCRRFGESARQWGIVQQPPLPLPPQLPVGDTLSQEDTYYSLILSAIFQNQPARWAAEPCSSSSSVAAYLAISTGQSAFAKWTSRSDYHSHQNPSSGENPQWLLKYILFTVPYLHNKYREENSPKSREGETSGGKLRKVGLAAQDELSANHVLAERRRREKLNEKFIILRSLVPFVTKMDKASILGDTIEYVKQLRKKIQDLESHNRKIETEPRNTTDQSQRTGCGSNCKDQPGRTPADVLPGRKRIKVGEANVETIQNKSTESGETPPQPPTLPSPPVAHPEAGTSVEVSIIGSDALIELQCGYREGLLFDIMQTLRDVRIETTAVLSSFTEGVFVAEVKAKIKDNMNGKKVSIMEVKRAINQIIPND